MIDNSQQPEFTSRSRNTKSNRGNITVFIGMLLLSIGFAGAAVRTSWQNHQREIKEKRKQLLPVKAAEVIGDKRNASDFRGEASSLFTLVEFGDYECPPCRAAEKELPALLQRYKGKVKMVFRNLPLTTIHPSAMSAATIAEAARAKGLFWTAHDVLFRTKLNKSSVARIARQSKVDANFSSLQLADAKRAVQRDVNAADRLEINGTPNFILCCPDGRVVRLRALDELTDYVK